MTRASYVLPGQTAARIANIRRLVAALAVNSMTRAEIGNLLQMGPSGVRKYIADLGARVSIVRAEGGPVYFLAMTPEQMQSYLAQLAAAPVSRPVGIPRRARGSASIGADRHIHVMQDDEHFSVRLHTAPPARDPLVAALFGARAEVRP